MLDDVDPLLTGVPLSLTPTPDGRAARPRWYAHYRLGGGFLTPGQWKAAMGAPGFVDTRFLPDIVRLREEVPDFFVAAIGATRP